MPRMRVRVFTASLMYEIISRLSETCARAFPTGPGANQCSANRTRTTRLHLTTSLLSWLLNSLLLSLICTGSSAPICLPHLFPSPSSAPLFCFGFFLFFSFLSPPATLWARAFPPSFLGSSGSLSPHPTPDTNFPLMSGCSVVSAEVFCRGQSAV